MNELLITGKTDRKPSIYAYSVKNNDDFEGLVKVGFTTKNVSERISNQTISTPTGLEFYDIILVEDAIRNDGSTFTDKEVHKMLQKMGKHVEYEWFRCSKDDVRNAILNVKYNMEFEPDRVHDFKMRDEQAKAVEKISEYFTKNSIEKTGRTPKCLLNAKMRFGKTFTTYKLAQKMNFDKILILTFKPSVVAAWESDLNTHVDFIDFKFYKASDFNGLNSFDASRKVVVFGSFQDILGKDENGNIKSKNEIIHSTNWDLVVFDEYHYGAWRDTSKGIFEDDEESSIRNVIKNANYDSSLINGLVDTDLDENYIKITTNNYLFMSGTPFRSLSNGEFIEDQIFNWSYSDEQEAKANCTLTPNPYEPLPTMVMLAYEPPLELKQITNNGEFDEFDLSKFFEANGKREDAKFTNEDMVQKWLDYIRSSYNPLTIDELKSGEKPRMPFSDAAFLEVLSHTVWFLPSVSSCYAMRNMLKRANNKFYQDYNVVVAAGKEAGSGEKALKPVFDAMGNPLKTKSITLTCGKLLTGSTVMPWTGIFVLCNLSSPETYFQAIFRVQSPWVVDDDNMQKKTIKHECFVFDFAINRALTMVSEYSRKTGRKNSSPKERVENFIKYLPIIAYDGSSMKKLSATDILDYTTSGTTASLLAKRFESATLVNVDNETLFRVIDSEEALEAISKIKDFRNMKVRENLSVLISKSNSIKAAKAEGEKRLPNGKSLTEEEKDVRKRRNEILEKLKKFATRIPIFMYLTDYREESLIDIIRCYEPELFEKVSGLTVEDFELLISLNLFNAPALDDAILKFKRYEDSSFEYVGIRKMNNQTVGAFSTSIKIDDFDILY